MIERTEKNEPLDLLRIRRPNRVKLHARPLRERMREADQLNATLIFVEVYVIGEYERFMHRAMQAARYSPLYRQELKRTLGEMQKLCKSLNRQCLRVDCEAILYHIIEVMPAYRSAYIAEGGGAIDRLNLNFGKLGMVGLANRLYEQVLMLCLLAAAREEELTASIYVVNAMAVLAIECYETISRQQNELLCGDVVMHRVQGKHNQRMSQLSHRALTLLMGNPDVISGYGMASQQVRSTLHDLQQLISGTDFVEVCNSTLTAAALEYTEYALAHLRVDIERGSVPERVCADLAPHLTGGHADVDELMEELRSTPLPAPPDEVDIWELASDMPTGREGGALQRFRRWAMERKELSQN